MLVISATHKLIRAGPSIDPCGTSKLVFKRLEIFESISTKYRLSVK